MSQEGQTAIRKVTWAGATTSNAINVAGFNASLRLELPATFTGTTLTYKVLSQDGETWVTLETGGVAVSDTVSGSLASMNVLSANLAGIDQLKIISDQSETCTGYVHGST